MEDKNLVSVIAFVLVVVVLCVFIFSEPILDTFCYFLGVVTFAVVYMFCIVAHYDVFVALCIATGLGLVVTLSGRNSAFIAAIILPTVAVLALQASEKKYVGAGFAGGRILSKDQTRIAKAFWVDRRKNTLT